jgi:2-polyprenyl-3-methyl-5-hydroxy-6-metoxy-1,4-benzoquinol methylase
MGLVEKLLRAIPYLRRPYHQRDIALAKLAAVTAELETIRHQGAPGRAGWERAKQFAASDTWFLSPDDDGRQDRAIGDFRAWIARTATAGTPALEFGPSLNPILPKRGGFNVTVVDHVGTPELIAKYFAQGLDVSKIEPVDIVSDGKSIAQATGGRKFDLIVAAHVIEHAPDLIQFLNDCANALSDNGSICLLVPDKRYGFDFFQPLTDTAKIISDHRLKRVRHSFESYYRLSACVRNGERIAWDQGGISRLSFSHGDPADVLRVAESYENSNSYIDVHENYFTPVSFAMIVDELRFLRAVDLELTTLTRSRGCEFLAVLRKAKAPSGLTVDGYLERKMLGYELLLAEESERVHSAKKPTR